MAGDSIQQVQTCSTETDTHTHASGIASGSNLGFIVQLKDTSTCRLGLPPEPQPLRAMKHVRRDGHFKPKYELSLVTLHPPTPCNVTALIKTV